MNPAPVLCNYTDVSKFFLFLILINFSHFYWIINSLIHVIPYNFIQRFFFWLVFFRRAALHSPQDKVAAVMGMDVTLGYFYKILAEKVPACEQPTVRWVICKISCRLIDFSRILVHGFVCSLKSNKCFVSLAVLGTSKQI